MTSYEGEERRRLPVDWLRAEIDMLRNENKERHERLRADMNSYFERLAAKLDQHAEDDRLVEKRVTIIETQREGESKQAIRRGTWAGLVAAAGLDAAIEVAKFLTSRR